MPCPNIVHERLGRATRFGRGDATIAMQSSKCRHHFDFGESADRDVVRSNQSTDFRAFLFAYVSLDDGARVEKRITRGRRDPALPRRTLFLRASEWP